MEQGHREAQDVASNPIGLARSCYGNKGIAKPRMSRGNLMLLPDKGTRAREEERDMTPRAREPKGIEWTSVSQQVVDGNLLHRYRSGPILVISSIQIAEMPDGNGTGPQWLVSISANGKRPKPHHVRRALRAFGMVGAENDTHHPGVAVHYWLPVDPTRRVDCQCKTDEDVIVEPDGYAWTNPKPGEGDCRGCELTAITGRACPIHAGACEAGETK